jgi:acyl dehydratase
VEVSAVRSTSTGNRGIVTTKNDVVNQHGEAVMTYRAVRMMAGRPA